MSFAFGGGITEVLVEIGADTKGFKKGMTEVSQASYAAGGAFSRFGTIARSFLSPVAIGLSAVALSAKNMGGFIKESSMLFLEYNDVMARTGAILGVTKGEMKALDTEVKKVGASTRFTASQVGEAANLLAIAGVSADEMISDKALENLVKFAIAGGVDIQTATSIGIAGVKAFGMEMEDLSHVSDVLTRTFTRSNVDIVSLGEGLKFAAPVAHSAGLAIEETAAAIGALGNAGLRGTVAGTGLRMSINKLLKPTFDSQKAINDLGLTVQVLSPAGEAAKNSLKSVTNQLDRTKKQTSSLSDEIRMLNGELTDLSIEQQSNSLAIEQIRQRAARLNRDLTATEIKQIERLQKANDSLRVNEMSLDLERAKTQRSLTVLTEKEKELDAESKTLMKTVEQQATGLTSLGDVLDQLASSGATTTQVLEIFGVRGGTAISSLLTQRDAFHALVEENENAAGATAKFTESIQGQDGALGSAKESFFLFMSAVQEAMLAVGAPFIEMLAEIALRFKDDIADGIKDNLPLFKDLAIQIGLALEQLVPMAIHAIPAFINGIKVLVPLVTMMAQGFMILMMVLSPFLQLLAGILQILQGIASIVIGIFTADVGTMKAGLASIGQGIIDSVIGGVGSALTVATGGLGSGLIGKTLMGGIGGSVFAGAQTAFGSLTSALFADGGVVTGPTNAIIGEAGPEAVVPLGAHKSAERQAVMSQAGLSGGGISIGNIVINGDARLTATEVRAMLNSELPKALNKSLLRGSRGTI